MDVPLSYVDFTVGYGIPKLGGTTLLSFERWTELVLESLCVLFVIIQLVIGGS